MDENKVYVSKETNDEGFTLVELWRIIQANIIWLILAVVLFIFFGWIYTFHVVTPMYKSSVDIFIHIEHDPEQSGTDSAKTTTVKQVASNVRECIKFRDIISTVLEEKGDEIGVSYDWQVVARRISTSTIGDATVVKVTYEDADPVVAQKMVTALAEELTRRLNLEKEHPDSLKFATEETKLQNVPDINPNQRPSSPNKPLNLIISFLLGIIVGVVFVILKEQFSNIFQSEKDVENTLKLPVIAMVPAADGGGEEIE